MRKACLPFCLFLLSLIALLSCQKNVTDPVNNNGCKMIFVAAWDSVLHGSYTLNYNDKGKIAQIIIYDSLSLSADTVRAVYDASSRVIATRFTDPGFYNNAWFVYNASGQLQKEFQALAGFPTVMYLYIYNGFSKPVRIEEYSIDVSTRDTTMGGYATIEYTAGGDIHFLKEYDFNGSFLFSQEYSCNNHTNHLKGLYPFDLSGLMQLQYTTGFRSWLNEHDVEKLTTTEGRGFVHQMVVTNTYDSTGNLVHVHTTNSYDSVTSTPVSTSSMHRNYSYKCN